MVGTSLPSVRIKFFFPFRCITCGEYIYKGKKFNARKEDVEGEDYLGIRIYRFYIKVNSAVYSTIPACHFNGLTFNKVKAVL
jgi:hypothetical protein